MTPNKSVKKTVTALRGDPVPVAAPASSQVAKQEACPGLTLQPDPDYFNLMLSDDNCLHVNLGEECYMLKPEQTARLQVFMRRIRLAGERE